MNAPAPLRDASTVVLLRDTATGPELFLVKRGRGADFMPDAHVFPGGRFDPTDAAPSACALLAQELSVLHKRLGEDLPAARAAGLFVAGMRETFEEAGLLLGSLAPGWTMNDAREAVGKGAQFTTLVSRLDAPALVPWVRWVTPPVSPKRFDARFFLARAPQGQEASIDNREVIEGVWITPQKALERWLDGEMQLAPATAKSIDSLATYATVDAVLAAAANRVPPVVMPAVWQDGGRAFISLPGDERHELGDVLGGRIRRIQLEGGRYRPVK